MRHIKLPVLYKYIPRWAICIGGWGNKLVISDIIIPINHSQGVLYMSNINLYESIINTALKDQLNKLEASKSIHKKPMEAVESSHVI